MIVQSGTYYLYRHIRKDNNSVFYVGIGKKSPTDINKGTYTRATTKAGHNFFWNRIVEKVGYRVEIILESNKKSFIEKKEIEFIKLYGRRDLNEGTLCNLNDGGNGFNVSKYSINKSIATKKLTGSYQKNVERMRKYAALHNSGESYCNRKTYVYNLDGTFYKAYKSRFACQEDIGVSKTLLARAVKNRESRGGYFITNFYTEKLNTSLFNIKTYKKPIVSLGRNTFKLIKTYESTSEAAKEIGSCKANIGHSIRMLKTCKGYYWAYEENYKDTVKALIKKRNAPCPEYRRIKARETFAKYDKENPGSRSHEKRIINIETGKILKGVSEILVEVGLSRRLMVRRLNGEIVNNTPYRYVDNKYSRKAGTPVTDQLTSNP